MKKIIFTIIIAAAVLIYANNIGATEKSKITKDCTDGVRSMYVSSENGLNIRNKPSSTSKVLGVLNYRDRVDVLLDCKDNKDWSIIWFNGATAYVYNEYLSVEKPKEIVVEKEDWYLEDIGTFRLTAYEWTGDRCANGNYPTEGYTIASIDLPLGTRVYINGYGEYTVEDTGAFPSGTLDIYLGDPDECEIFGVQYGHVYVLSY